MHFNLLNLYSALTIGAIIAAMAMIKNVQLKATIYSLPLPITIALIATNGKIGSANITGLLLLSGFLTLVHKIRSKTKLPIIMADVISATAYIVTGYIFVKIIQPNFIAMVIGYILIWVILIYILHKRPSQIKPNQLSTISPYLKGAGTTAIALLLFSVKDILSGVVVTFPFSGVFAVIETKNHLDILARIFFRNSLAILSLFVAMRILQPHMPFAAAITLAWVVYFVVLKIVQRISI